jgi:hypothetical protein
MKGKTVDFFLPSLFIVLGSWIEKIRIRDKHPGSATLEKTLIGVSDLDSLLPRIRTQHFRRTNPDPDPVPDPVPDPNPDPDPVLKPVLHHNSDFSTSVADPEPGSGAFLTPKSGMGKI